MAKEVYHVGEIVDSSTTEFIAESRLLNRAPPFGSFVKVSTYPAVYAIIFNVSTHSIEPNRRPTAYGKTEEELRLEQPQIFELLRTEFQTLIIGYQDEGGIYPSLPPHPPPIHSFVYLCSAQEILQFTEDMYYLRAIFTATGMPVDELLIASIRNAYLARDQDYAYLIRAGKEAAKLLKDDYDRLSSIIRRIH